MSNAGEKQKKIGKPEMVGGGALVSQPKILSSIVSNRFLHASHPCQLHQLFRYGAGLSPSLCMHVYMYTYTGYMD